MNKTTGYEEAQYYKLDGKISPNIAEHPRDLINIPTKKARWAIANFNHHGTYVTGLVTREDAERSRGHDARPGWYIVGKIEGTEIEE